MVISELEPVRKATREAYLRSFYYQNTSTKPMSLLLAAGLRHDILRSLAYESTLVRLRFFMVHPSHPKAIVMTGLT
jgi:hypothetical protein